MPSYFLICNGNVICNGKKWQQVPTTHNHPHGMHQLTMFTRKLIEHTSHREQVSPSYISGGLSTYIFSVSVFLHGWKASASKGKSRSDNAKLKAHPAQELHKPSRMAVVGADKGKKARISAASARAHTRNSPSQSRSSSFSTAGSFLCFSLPIHPPIFLRFSLPPSVLFCAWNSKNRSCSGWTSDSKLGGEGNIIHGGNFFWGVAGILVWSVLLLLVAVAASLVFKTITPPPPKLLNSSSPDGLAVTAPRVRMRDGRFLAYKERGVPREMAQYHLISVHGYGRSRHDIFRASEVGPHHHHHHFASSFCFKCMGFAHKKIW